MIRRHFFWDGGNLNNNGLDGWMPLFVPRTANFYPSGGARGIIHDGYEHGLGEDGSFPYEVMAFGRILALRHHTGYMSISVDSLGHGLYDTWTHDSDTEPFTAPRVGRCRSCVADVHEIVAAFAKAERQDSEKSHIPSPTQHIALANLLQIGLRDAHRRYGGREGIRRFADAAAQFTSTFKAKGEPGDMLVVDYDRKTHKFKYRVTTKDGDGRQHPRWVQERIRAWKNAW